MSVKIVGGPGFYESVCRNCGEVLGSGSERCVLPTVCLSCEGKKKKEVGNESSIG